MAAPPFNPVSPEVLLEHLPMAVAVFDTDLRLRRWNSQWADLVSHRRGVMSEDVQPGRYFFDLAPGTESAVLPVLRQVLSGETVDAGDTCIEIGGRKTWWAGSVVPLHENGHVTGLIEIATDVTERRRGEDELRAREAQYEAVFKATGDGLVVTDLDGKIVAANPAFHRMHGVGGEDIHGRHVTSFVHPAHHAVYREYVEAVRNGKGFQAQTLGIRADGSLVPVEIHGSAFEYNGTPHVLAVVRDDSERARAFQLLEQRINTLTSLAAKLTVANSLDEMMETIAKTVVDASSAVGCEVDVIGMCCIQGVSPGDITTDPEARLRPVILPLRYQDAEVGTMTVVYPAGIHIPNDEATFVAAIANKAAAAVQNARLHADAQASAGLMERQRLARDLHDSVSQALYGIALGAQTARTLADRDPKRLTEPLDYVLSLAQAGLAEMRALIFALRPESLESEGLVAALDHQVAALRARHHLDVDAVLGSEPNVPLVVKEAVYRIAQEALHNIVKHAGATFVSISLETVADELVLTVTDDGIGFDANAVGPGHLGLQGMRERVAELGGRVDVTGAAQRGSRVCARLPR